MIPQSSQWHPVTSSQIQEIAFTDEKLFVRFNTGSVYQYPDAPKAVFDEMLRLQENGESIGKYWNSVKGTLNFTKVE